MVGVESINVMPASLIDEARILLNVWMDEETKDIATSKPLGYTNCFSLVLQICCKMKNYVVVKSKPSKSVRNQSPLAYCERRF